jgi:endonuclease YncB( thermonuclease family)
LLAALLAGAAQAAGGCDAAPSDAAPIAVRRTIDGDTVVLRDGRHLRLIGANALELGRDGAPDQPFARSASDRLRALIERGGLRFAPGRERLDRHGRTLGELFGADGRSLSAVLVEEGLALAVAVPPNDAAIGCLLALEAQARAARRGLWAAPERWTVAARTAPASLRGFARVTGEVSARRERRGGLSVELDGRVELWVADAARAALAPRLAEVSPGTTLTVRGWWGAYRGRPSLRLVHPAQLETAP